MNSIHFDRIDKNAAAAVSRRGLLRGVAAATALSGVAWPEGRRGSASGQGAHVPTAGGIIPTFTPHLASPFPIPLGGNRFLMNGRNVSVDLQQVAAAFRSGAAVFPVVVDEAIFELTPALVARAAQPATPVATPAAAEAQAGERLLLERLIGESLEAVCLEQDESMDVEFYDGKFPEVSVDFVRQKQPMVGLLQWRGDVVKQFDNATHVNARRVCSGTLIDDNLFLTAGHCIIPDVESGLTIPTFKGTQTPIPEELCAKNMKVVFDFQLDSDGNPKAPRPFNVVALEEYEKSDWRDYAILQLEGHPGEEFGVSLVRASDPDPGSSICVIGHPNVQEKRIAAGTAKDIAYNWILYSDVDTVGGNSGSGILDSPDGPLIGIHLGGNCDEAGERGTNYGLRIGALLPISPILSSLAQ